MAGDPGRQYRNRAAGRQEDYILPSLVWRVHGGDNTAMASARTFIGIDGCRAGWFCVSLDEQNAWSCHVVPDARAMETLVTQADSVLIDIPIGLPDSGPEGRLCDREARRLLGRGRAASVFSAPARCTLAAASYTTALELNRQASGRGLSKQAWNIVPKIREIDTLLCNKRALRGVLRECHPELCFWALNGKQAMHFSKKKVQGQQQRLRVLERYLPQCHALFEQACSDFLRREVARDDIIDAMVCAVTARYGHGQYRTAPASAVLDGQRLPMEIVYYLPDHDAGAGRHPLS
jgi:predicted RNase H-like nuclease